MPAVRTHTYRSPSPTFKLSARCQGSPHLAACMVIFFFSRTLIEITIPGFWIKRDQKSVFSLTLCLSHIIIPHDVRCQPTLGQGYFIFFFTESHPHCALACSRIQMWVRDARVVVKWKKSSIVWNNEVRVYLKINWTSSSEEVWQRWHVVVGRARWEMYRDSKENNFIFLIKSLVQQFIEEFWVVFLFPRLKDHSGLLCLFYFNCIFNHWNRCVGIFHYNKVQRGKNKQPDTFSNEPTVYWKVKLKVGAPKCGWQTFMAQENYSACPNSIRRTYYKHVLSSGGNGVSWASG